MAFGALILLVGLLGGLAIWRITLATSAATEVSEKRAPEVGVANDLVIAAWDTRYEIRQYLLLGDADSLRKGRKVLAKVKEHLITAGELVKKHTDMVALNQAQTLIRDRVADFETLLDKMEAEHKTLDVQTLALNTNGDEYSKQCVKLRLSQAQKMNEDLAEWAGGVRTKAGEEKTALAGGKELPEKAGLAALQERLAKMRQVEDLIDQANFIRVESFQALAEKDAEALRAVLKRFAEIEKISATLAPLLRQQENLSQLSEITKSADAYKLAMENILKGELALTKGKQDLFTAGAAVTVAAEALGDQGVATIEKAATEVASGLSLTSSILVGGVLVALIAGVLIAWLSTRAITGPIRDGVNTLASTAAQISTTVAQLASNASEAAAAVAETTTTVEEVRQTAQVAADRAKAVADSSQGAALAAETGRKATDMTVQGLNLIRGQMSSIGESITRLSEQSQAVGDIVSTVTDLAEQSNLLAVNASIEAAKAGEMGKGFAVVAQEIRNLAEQSKESTKQVRAILTDVQKATGNAVLAAEQGGRGVADGSKQADEAGQAIRTLTSSVQEATRAAVQIAASSQQQLVGMEQVGRAMENIKQATSQNAEGARQLASAAHNLQEVGARLRAMVTADQEVSGATARK